MRLVPSAAGRAAVAVGGIAESGLIVRLTRGPAWIGLIAILLVGIVALNVGTLSLNSAASRTGSQADELRLSNSSLRGDLAAASSSTLVTEESAKLGYSLPAAGDVRYVQAGPDDAAKAAERLKGGELAGGVAVVPDGESTPEELAPPETIDPVTGVAIDPATGAPIDPATGAPVVSEVGIDPATGLPLEATTP
ncbi:hypothetical protein HJD18_06295 [Thermoleophilia bacterium SCSIO 60948]|nr:hypothetical protein HJD18_06295 [Thermoleophilia bacterium SCSIO 60948]